MTLTKLCPCCGNALGFDADDNFVWCGNCRCASEIADNGVEILPNETPEQAADRLIAELNKEPDWE